MCSASPRVPPEPPAPDPLTTQGVASDDACTRLRRIRQDDTDNAIRRGRAHTDDLIRVLRNLTALAVFTSATLLLIAYAGVRMGVPPQLCIPGSVSAAALLVRTFAKAFESIRPSLPDAPKAPPSGDER
ncbi:hypothetical protein ACIRQQ_09620 [Streptomyces fuscichromogenes]|uniref:hypothetical protein n=1 Tax=Streptomyces fuscichromogenes TaxID=1324013 RepID=UPI0038280632